MTYDTLATSTCFYMMDWSKGEFRIRVVGSSRSCGSQSMILLLIILSVGTSAPSPTRTLLSRMCIGSHKRLAWFVTQQLLSSAYRTSIRFRGFLGSHSLTENWKNRSMFGKGLG